MENISQNIVRDTVEVIEMFERGEFKLVSKSFFNLSILRKAGVSRN